MHHQIASLELEDYDKTMESTKTMEKGQAWTP